MRFSALFEFMLGQLEHVGGMIRKLANPQVSQHCQELLEMLQDQIETNGFDRKEDTDILQKIYGRRYGAPSPPSSYQTSEVYASVFFRNSSVLSHAAFADTASCT